MLGPRLQPIIDRMWSALNGGHPAHLTVQNNNFMVETLRSYFPGQAISMQGEFWTVHPKRWDKKHLGPKPVAPPPLIAS